MSKQHRMARCAARAWVVAIVLCLAAGAASAQQPTPAQPAPAPKANAPDQATDPGKSTGGKADEKDKPKPETHITPEQAKELFALVDQLIKFSSDETGLAIKSEVKRKMTTRAEVEADLKQKFEEDQGAKRLQQGEIVLNKFGLLDRDFALKPFLLELLKEQIEAFYDSKTKTVNMLDWVDIEEQKPVLAHELTHALQDQHTDLEKWSDQTPDEVSHNAHDDTDHLARDEMDTAREAVVEGQATAVMMDYILKPMGKSLIKDPEVMDVVKEQMSGSENSPVLARAPVLLSESLLFPYKEGLSFEQDVWMDKGQAAAFSGALDVPPSSSWEIMNPRQYEARHLAAVPLMPDIHPLVDKDYKAYDIGQVGQLDLHILAEIYGGDAAAGDLTPAWDGGIYWAGQRLSAKTPAELASTKSIALLYLSRWKSSASAQAFASLYAKELPRKYSGVKPDEAAQLTAPTSAPAGDQEQDFITNEGPVVITVRGPLVFVAESFDLPTARKLATLLMDAQGSGELRLAAVPLRPGMQPAQTAGEPLTAPWVRFFSNCGVMKAVVDAVVRTEK